MTPWTDSGPVDATFSIVGDGHDFEITFESGDGNGRNPQYNEGLELVLARLIQLDATLMRARITAKGIDEKAAAVGLPTSFIPTPYLLPLPLKGDLDVGAVRRALSRVGGKVLSEPGSKGSPVRRLTLDLHLPMATPAEVFATHLMGRPQGGPADGLTLTMATDLATCDAGFLTWIAALETGARAVRPGQKWVAAERIMFSTRPSAKRAGATDVRLGVRFSGEPWTVEINAPRIASDANGLATIALDLAGRPYLVRQGYLRANPDSHGDVPAEDFRVSAGVMPVDVQGGSTPTPRIWYLVADLGAPADDIRRRTGEFVDACARARELSKPPGASSAVVAGPSRFSAGEKGGSFTVNAIEAQPAKEVRRLQGEVWLALAARLEAVGMKLLKPRHEGGYEVDGFIEIAGGLLLEIKSAATPADVYEGVGQLLLYESALKIAAKRRVLLLPPGASPVLVAAAGHHGVEVHSYGLTIVGDEVKVAFGAGFLGVCGLS